MIFNTYIVILMLMCFSAGFVIGNFVGSNRVINLYDKTVKQLKKDLTEAIKGDK